MDRVVRAGTFLQEHFVSRLSTLLGCTFDKAHQRLQQRLAAAAAADAGPAARIAVKEEEGEEETAAGHFVSTPKDSRAAAAAAAAAAFETPEGEGGVQLRKEALLKMTAALAAAPSGDDGKGQMEAAAAAAVVKEKLLLSRLSDAAMDLLRTQRHPDTTPKTFRDRQQQTETALNPWLLLRQYQTRLAAAGVRPTAAAAAQQLRELLRVFKCIQNLPEQRRQVLLMLSSSPLLQQQLPRVARLLQTERMLPLYVQPARCSNKASAIDTATRETIPDPTVPPPNIAVRHNKRQRRLLTRTSFFCCICCLLYTPYFLSFVHLCAPCRCLCLFRSSCQTGVTSKEAQGG